MAAALTGAIQLFHIGMAILVYSLDHRPDVTSCNPKTTRQMIADLTTALMLILMHLIITTWWTKQSNVKQKSFSCAGTGNIFI